MLKVNGIAVASPSEMQVRIFDVGSQPERSADGGLVIDRVAVKRALKLKWPALSAAQMGALLSAVSDGFFTVTCFDPLTAAEREMVCRCGERSAGVLCMRDGAPVWSGVEMEWTER